MGSERVIFGIVDNGLYEPHSSWNGIARHRNGIGWNENNIGRNRNGFGRHRNRFVRHENGTWLAQNSFAFTLINTQHRNSIQNQLIYSRSQRTESCRSQRNCLPENENYSPISIVTHILFKVYESLLKLTN